MIDQLQFSLSGVTEQTRITEITIKICYCSIVRKISKSGNKSLPPLPNPGYALDAQCVEHFDKCIH